LDVLEEKASCRNGDFLQYFLIFILQTQLKNIKSSFNSGIFFQLSECFIVQQDLPFVAVRFNELRALSEEMELENNCNWAIIRALPNVKVNRNARMGKSIKRCVQVPKQYFTDQNLFCLSKAKINTDEETEPEGII
jgi:hypothetical protein